MTKQLSSREIFHILETEIINLKLKPGATLSEHGLCERFGVSRSPIRSVLQELRLCGLVEIEPYKGTWVTLMDFNIISQIIYQRTAIETFVIEDFIRLQNLMEIEKLRHINHSIFQLLENDDFEASQFYAMDSKLHETWFAATQKEYLWQGIQKSDCHYTRFRMLDIVEIQNYRQIADEHAAILQAIDSGDIPSIRPLVQKHLSGGITRLGQRIFTDLKDYFTFS